MRYRIIILLFITITFAAFSQSPEQQIDELVTKYAEYKLFNGAVLVADETGILFSKGYGYANFEWKIPNAPDVKFRLGSITKQFTAMVIMQLVQEGKIKLDGKITDYLDYYRKDTGEKVTIHQLLTHSSGIPSYTANPDFFSKVSRMYYKPDDFVKEYCMGNFEYEPGSKFSYNNSGYFILGAIIEKLTGKTYETNLQERIFSVLGMKSTGFDLAEPVIEKRAAGYEKSGSGFVNAAFIDMSLPYAAGSLYSTVGDLYLWDRALYTDKLLEEEYKQIYFKPYIPARESQYAYGWFISKNKSWNENKELTLVTHGGGINGFNTALMRVVEDKKLVVLLNNTGETSLNDLGSSILNILYDRPYSEPRIPIAIHMESLLADRGLDGAVKEYKRISAEEKDKFNLDEEQLNNLGYSLLRSGKTKEALTIFYLNVETYPEAFNVYDSYAEALAVDGQKEKAIENYKKSLELNPRNTNAVKQLNTLGVAAEEKKDAVVPVEILKTYEGEYQVDPKMILKITTEKERIYAQGTGQPRIQIFPETETKFYVKVVDAVIEFQKEKDGKVKGLILYQGGQEFDSPKIK